MPLFKLRKEEGWEPPLGGQTYRGRPQFQDACIGCGACAEVCPPKAIQVKDQGEEREIELDFGKCIRCGQCASACPVEGIKVTPTDGVFVRGEERKSVVKRKLVRCENCGQPITTIDHFRWMVERLGTLSFSNPTLIRFATATDSAGPFRILCPRCRRLEYLSDHGWRAKY
jgi:hydrogenase-4 component H